MHRITRALGVTAALVVIAGLLGAGSAAAGEEETDPMAGAPAVGACYNLTWKQAYATSTDEATVACSTHHTLVVVGVGQLPTRVDWEGDEDRLRKAMGKVCDTEIENAVRFRWRLIFRSQYTGWMLRPTAEQRDAGSRWFTCLVGVADDRGLADLPHPLPKLSKHMPDSIARCLTTKRDSTTCADRHRWRATYSFSTGGRLTTKNLDRAAANHCPRHVGSRPWLRSGHAIGRGGFVVVCFAKTRH